MLRFERPTIGALLPSLRTTLIRALFGRLDPPSLFGQARKKCVAVSPSIGVANGPACGTKYEYPAFGTCACAGTPTDRPINVVRNNGPSLVFIGSPQSPEWAHVERHHPSHLSMIARPTRDPSLVSTLKK